ncbi:MAG: amino acid adenylation domain-containing protein, partial [Prochloraceae cyanobacterium]
LQEQGISADERVAIFLERSPLMIVALMAILKAGGAYVPIEPTLPQERVRLILTNSQAKILITQQSLTGQISAYSGSIIEFEKDWEAIFNNREENLITKVTPKNLVYVIYTSGSTGTPKGVAIEHRQLLNYLEGITERLNLPPNASYALISTLGADLGNTVIFPALCSGGCLHIISQDNITDPVALGAYFEEQGGIDCLKIVPSHLRALLKDLPNQAQILPRKRLVLGGEALSWALVEQVQRLAPNCQILNHYGPTETTVGVLTYAVPTEELVKNSATVPLGQPLPNTQIFLLDEQLSPVPLGYPGELYIGGNNLARGYLNQPNLASESFNSHPFNQRLKIKIKNQRLKIKITRGQWFHREAKFKLQRADKQSDTLKKHKFALYERLYRTGDLARYLPDGNIEFLGRLDHQVKLHGFRIELGEIETLLNRYQGVAEAVVMVSEKTTDEKRLVAYILPENNINPPTLKELRHYLQEKLPEYMIPAAFMILERLPLTANGKLDRYALPAVTTTRSDLDSLYIAPRTAQEQILAKIWAGVLGIEKVGVNDNFFELGGDSILSIQIVARAKAAGLKLTPTQLFHHQTIAELASISQSELPQIQLGEVTGQVPLTPIQHWFFQQELPHPAHWNMSMLVETPANLRQDYLETAIQALSSHHHSLGLYFEFTESGWQQRYGDRLAKVPCLYVNLAATPEAELASTISTKASEIQSSLNLATSPLMKVVWFDCGRDKPGRLLVVVHHLLIDGVSWRIWLEDLETAYKQVEAGNQIQLPAQTTSFKYWSQKLTEYASGIRVFQELDYWLEQAPTQAAPLPKDFNEGTNTFATAETMTVTLDSNHTQLALQQVSSIDNTQINDLLLTALLFTYNSWTGENSLLVELEGHGREYLFEEVDLSRTLGWFTTHFPQLLTWEPGTEPAIALQSVKAQLRACPNHGIGYGLLRYLCNNQEIMSKLENLPQPEICFNYLGQFNQFSSLFPIVMEQRGQERNGSSQRTHEINIDVVVINGHMHFEWTYSSERYQRATIEKLAQDLLTALKKLIEELLDSNKSQTLPMTPELGLTKLQLAQIQNKFDAIADIYPLSPLQQGILFHSRYHQESNLYCQQKLFTLQGSLNVAAFKEAWQTVVNRHDSLKTAFVWENLTNPLQVVPTAIAIPWTEHNWLDLSPTEQEQKLDIYLKQDLPRGFALDRPPLMRMALFQIASDRYQLLWSHHHLILDGWCNSVIFKEVFTLYEALCQEKNINLPPSPLYKDYITWLQQQDNSQAQVFWYQALKGVKAPTRWGIEQTVAKFNEHQIEYAEQEFALSPQTTAALNTWAKSHRLTFNTLIQGSFALLLSRYSGEEDVIFGGTVSGRPPELEGVESMVGLLINTLPVRVQVCGEVSLLDWLQQIQQQQIQRLEYQYNSLVQIQQWSQLNGGTPLFESFITVENYPIDASLLSGEGSLKILGCRSSFSSNYPLSVTVELNSSISVVISYDSQQFEMTAIRQILQQFKTVLETLPAYGSTCLSDIPIATTTETQELIDSFNADLE